MDKSCSESGDSSPFHLRITHQFNCDKALNLSKPFDAIDPAGKKIMIHTHFRSARFRNLQTMIKNFVLIVSITFAAVFVCSITRAEQIQTYTVADGLVGPVVPIIFQDSRGVLWFGSDRGGVTQFYDNIFKSYAGSFDGSEDVEAGALLGQTQKIVEDKWGTHLVSLKEPLRKIGQGESVRWHFSQFYRDRKRAHRRSAR